MVAPSSGALLPGSFRIHVVTEKIDEQYPALKPHAILKEQEHKVNPVLNLCMLACC